MKKRSYFAATAAIASAMLLTATSIGFPTVTRAEKSTFSNGTALSTSAVAAYMDDDLDDFDKVSGHGADLAFETNKPEMFEGDFSRVRRGGNGNDCWLSWEYATGITEFGVVTYWENAAGNITVSASTDNVNWTSVGNAEIFDSDLGYGWYKRVFKFYGITETAKYVRIDFGTVSEGGNTGPHISRVRINSIDGMDDPDRYLEGRESETFYIDSSKGSDYNIGTSETKPLKSLKKLSKRYFQPGDKILLKSGCTFKGTFIFKGNGSAAAPVTIGTYGGTSQAKISASEGNALSVKMQYVTVENLEITNPNGMMGIYILPSAAGENNNITVRNCYIHDINTNQVNYLPGRYDSGGIIVSTDGTEPTWINNLVIENNIIERTSRCGIFMTSEWAYRPGVWGREGYYKNDDDGWYPYTGTIIRQNTVNGCFGDSILITCAKNTLVEKNTVINGFNNTNNITGIACASVWGTNTNDTVYQYNDVSYTSLPLGCADGEAFDIDISSKRNTVQYNYTHDNEGGMLLICNNDGGAAVSGGHTVRFNLSVNDGSTKKIHSVFMIEGENPYTHFYNNTVYMNGVTDTVIKQYGSMVNHTTEDYTFTNNIFYGATGKSLGWRTEVGWKNTVFNNNVFCNVNVEELKGTSGITVCNSVFTDPEFANEAVNTAVSPRDEIIEAFTPSVKLCGAENVSNFGGKDISGRCIDKIDFYGCAYYAVNSYADSLTPDSYNEIIGAGVQLKYRAAVANTAIPAGWCLMNDSDTSLADGETVYYIEKTVKSVRFDMSYQTGPDNNGWMWSSPPEFYVSGDGVNYEKITTERICGVSADSVNFPNVYAHVYDLADFGKEQHIHYLKIKTNTASEQNLYIPRIFGIDYNTFESEYYSNSFDLLHPYELTDAYGSTSAVRLAVADNLDSAASGTDHRRIWWGTFAGDPRGWSEGGITADTSIPLVGYNIQTADGASGSSGTVTYYSSKTVRNLRFDTSYSTAEDYWIAEPLEFFVSSDGVIFKKLTTVRDTAGIRFTRNVCEGMYSQIYDYSSFTEEENIHYIRIVSTLKGNNVFSKSINRIYAVDYDVYSENVDYPINFNIKKPYSVTDMDGDSTAVKLGVADSINSAAPGKADGIRVFYDSGDFVGNPNWITASPFPTVGYNIQKSDGSNGASGMVTYYSTSAVSNIRFDTSYSTADGYFLAEPFKFYASDDGVTYKRFIPERSTVGIKFTRDACDGMYSQIYDMYTFPKSDNVHYVRIVSTLKGDNAFSKAINRIYAIDYDIYTDGSEILTGDANNDGTVDVSDLVHLKMYLADEKKNGTLRNCYAADVNKDGNLNAGDIAALKKLLLGT